MVPAEPYPISRLAGRLDTSLDFSGSVPLWPPHSPESPSDEQALDLRVAGRRRADSLDRSPSPTESESTTGSPGRSPALGHLGHPALSGGSTGGLGSFAGSLTGSLVDSLSASPASSLVGSLVGSLAGSPPGLSCTPSSPPTLSYVFCSPAAGSSVCGSPPQLGSICSSPPQLGSVCSSPPQSGSICSTPTSPGSPERAARGRQTSVIRRLVLDRPTTQHSEEPRHDESPQQQQQQQHKQQQHEQHSQQHQHQQQQQQQHPCDQCGRKYSTASNLARHRQLHCLPTDKKVGRSWVGVLAALLLVPFCRPLRFSFSTNKSLLAC